MHEGVNTVTNKPYFPYFPSIADLGSVQAVAEESMKLYRRRDNSPIIDFTCGLY
jgi:hypothetical protein